MSVSPGIGAVGYSVTHLYPSASLGSAASSSAAARTPNVTSIGNFTSAPDTQFSVSRLVQVAPQQTSTISQYTVTIQNNNSHTSLTGRLFLNGRVTTITTFTPAQYAQLTYASGQAGSTDRITVSVTASGVASSPVQLISTVTGSNSGNALSAIQTSAPIGSPSAPVTNAPAPSVSLSSAPAPASPATAVPSVRDVQSGFSPKPAPGTVTYSISAAGAARIGVGGSSVSILTTPSSTANPATSLFDQLSKSVKTAASPGTSPSFTLSANSPSATSLTASVFNPNTPSYSSTSLIPSLSDLLTAQSTESQSALAGANFSLQRFGAQAYLKAQTLYTF